MLQFVQSSEHVVNAEVLVILRKQLDKDKRGSLASARTMIDLALVYNASIDDHEALELLQEAEKVLYALGGPPDGAGLAASLEKAMLAF